MRLALSVFIPAILLSLSCCQQKENISRASSITTELSKPQTEEEHSNNKLIFKAYTWDRLIQENHSLFAVPGFDDPFIDDLDSEPSSISTQQKVSLLKYCPKGKNLVKHIASSTWRFNYHGFQTTPPEWIDFGYSQYKKSNVIHIVALLTKNRHQEFRKFLEQWKPSQSDSHRPSPTYQTKFDLINSGKFLSKKELSSSKAHLTVYKYNNTGYLNLASYHFGQGSLDYTLNVDSSKTKIRLSDPIRNSKSLEHAFLKLDNRSWAKIEQTTDSRKHLYLRASTVKVPAYYGKVISVRDFNPSRLFKKRQKIEKDFPISVFT